MDNIKKMINVAISIEKADLVLKNANIINVFTQSIEIGDIAIVEDTIVGIGNYNGIDEVDCTDMYVVPGFIDSHVHIESSMVTPEQFSKLIIQKGVTTVIADPHEIANVQGVRGLEFMLENSKKAKIDIFYMLPSCVPATKFEDNGYKLTKEELVKFIHKENVLGLGEVMDVKAVMDCDEEIISKIQMAKHKNIDGHCPKISEEYLNAYISCGIKTDHECCDYMEALEKVKKGMYVMLREGSAGKNLRSLLPAVNKDNYQRFMFCTDDRHIEDLMDEGSIDNCVRLSIRLGLDPIKAMTLASFNAAKCYELNDRGAVAPGYKADIVILEDLKKVNIKRVFKNGKEVKKDENKRNSVISIKTSMNIDFIEKEVFKVKSESNNVNVIKIIPNSLETKKEIRRVVSKNGFVENVKGNDVIKIAIFERHHKTLKHFVGFVEGFGLDEGAIAQSIAHDSHNIIVVGKNDKDMEIAVNSLITIGGGITIASQGKLVAHQSLAIGGIMSYENPYIVSENIKRLNRIAKGYGVKKDVDPFLTLSFISLPVIPELKITSRGLFEFEKFEFIELFLK